MIYLPKFKAKADNTCQGLNNFPIMQKLSPTVVSLIHLKLLFLIILTLQFFLTERAISFPLLIKRATCGTHHYHALLLFCRNDVSCAYVNLVISAVDMTSHLNASVN